MAINLFYNALTVFPFRRLSSWRFAQRIHRNRHVLDVDCDVCVGRFRRRLLQAVCFLWGSLLSIDLLDQDPARFHQKSRRYSLPAALGIPSSVGRNFSRKSKYPPAQSICKVRNKFRSCVRKLLAGSGFYRRRAQKNRWKYRISTGFSPLPAASQDFS